MSKAGANPNITAGKFASGIMQNIQIMSQAENQNNVDFPQKSDIINIEEKKEKPNTSNDYNTSINIDKNANNEPKTTKTKNPKAHSNDPNKVRQTIFITKKNLILLQTLSFLRHQDQTTIVNDLLDNLQKTLTDREKNYYRDNLREENLL